MGPLGCPPRTALPRRRGGAWRRGLRVIPPAWAADVISSNVVGYNKVTLTQGYNMLAPMFTYVGGGDKQIPDLFEEDDFVSADTDAEADYISLWEDGGYSRTYFFSSDAGDAWSDTQDGFDETTDTLDSGLGFWLYNRGGTKTVTLTGQVPTTDVEFDVAANTYTMLANPFSAPLPIKSIVPVTGEFTSADTDAEADYISLWEDGGYSRTYFFSSDAGDAWSDTQDGFDETEDTIPAGLGFWFYRRGSSITIKLPAPYTL